MSKEVVDKKGKSKEAVVNKSKLKEIVDKKGKSKEAVVDKGKVKEVFDKKDKAKEVVDEKNKKKEIGESSYQDPNENEIVETLSSSTNFLKSLLESEEKEESSDN
ncbi:18414_t:CDS:2 [Gigaspora rosea]|nr:18414_t:CDS:2 [Gigaspora rosea]